MVPLRSIVALNSTFSPSYILMRILWISGAVKRDSPLSTSPWVIAQRPSFGRLGERATAGGPGEVPIQISNLYSQFHVNKGSQPIKSQKHPKIGIKANIVPPGAIRPETGK